MNEIRNSSLDCRSGWRAKGEPKPETRSGGAQGPALPPPGGPLDGAWIEIFRAGDYGERGNWTPDDLDRVAAAYDPRRQAAPIVLGHPADDAPAYGWVKRLRRAGQSLWAQLEKVDPALEALLRAGRFAQRSVALYKQFPPTGGPYLRHVGFLGAAPPGVKGLAAVRFADAPFHAIDAQFHPIAFVSSSDPTPAAGAAPRKGAGQAGLNEELNFLGDMTMSAAKSKLELFVDHLRSFFLPDPQPPHATQAGEGSAEPSPVPPSASDPAAGAAPRGDAGQAGLNSVGAATFAERLAALEQRREAVTSAKMAAEHKLAAAEVNEGRAGIAKFVEVLRAQGRFPPMYERWGVGEFMERLATVDASAPAVPPTGFGPLAPAAEAAPRECAGQAGLNRDAEAEPALLSWFQEFLSKLPAVIEFRELGSSSWHRSPAAGSRAPVVRFTEPQRGMSVDPASVELAERAEALAAEEGISYAEALVHLREARRSPTSA